MVGRDACIGAPSVIERNTSTKSVHINILPVLSEVLRWRNSPMMRHGAALRHGTALRHGATLRHGGRRCGEWPEPPLVWLWERFLRQGI